MKRSIMLLPLLVTVATVCNVGCFKGSNTSALSQGASSPAPGDSGHVNGEGRTELMRSFLKREGPPLNLEDLKEVRLSPSESELRVWVGFGVLVPRCFVLKRGNGGHQALYLTVQDSSVKPRPLTSPQGGWPEFDQVLKDHKVVSPIGLKPHDEFAGDPDEEIIAIELKSGDRYDLVHYSVGTQSQDGKTAISLCKSIEKAFGIRMGCEAVP